MSILFSHFFTKINEIAPLEADFTEVLSTIALKPKMLYFYGKMPENVAKTGSTEVAKSGPKSPQASAVSSSDKTVKTRPKTVAIVGSRHNTRYGAEVAYNLAYKLAQKGVIVVSGMAYGIDSIAHRGCLDAGGVTVAVLGTPIDQIYPREHVPLAAEILEKGGVVMSEYAPRDAAHAQAPLAPGEAGWDGERWHNPLSVEYRQKEAQGNLFGAEPAVYAQRKIENTRSFLYRNRLIAGLSDLVIVVEAAAKSGSLNTASHALEQGKDVFAVPGNITNRYSMGCNQLIAQGATPCLGPEQILRLLFPEDYIVKKSRPGASKLQGSTPYETAVLQALGSGLRDGEQIAAAAQLTPDIFYQTITVLELKERVRALGANQWALG